MSKENKKDVKRDKINDLFEDQNKSEELLSQINNQDEFDLILKSKSSNSNRGLKNLQEVIVSRIIELRVRGEVREEIVNIICREYNISSPAAIHHVTQALEEIKKRASEISEMILSQHIDRYDKLYKWFNENGFTKHALKALQYRERLIGLHSENKEIEFNNIYIGESQVESSLDLNRLSSQEKRLTMALIKKCKVIDIKID